MVKTILQRGEGNASANNGENTFHYEDKCLEVINHQYTKVNSCDGSNGNLCVLQEAFCIGNSLSNVAYTCPNGCRDGACIKSSQITKKSCTSKPEHSTWWEDGYWYSHGSLTANYQKTNKTNEDCDFHCQ